MIYATEQQVIVTAVLIVTVALIALFCGMWWGHGRGLEQAAEEQRWEREQEQVKARRTRPVYRQPLPEVAHEAWVYTGNSTKVTLDQDLALISPQTAITTGEIQAITDEMDSWLAEHVYAAPTDYGAWLEQQDRQ